MHIDKQQFEDFFTRPLEKCYGLELKIACLVGFLKKEKNGYAMTAKGAYYYHRIEYFYTLSYIDRMWSLMQKDAFPAKLVIR